MSWEQRTKFVLYGAAVLLVAYDVVAIHMGGDDASISRVALKMAREHPILAVLVGFVIGHIFWSN